MKTYFILIVILLSVTGCDPVQDQVPRGFNKIVRPITVVSCNEKGLTVTGGDGKLYAWKYSYYFVPSIVEAGYKKGDILVSLQSEDSK